MGLYKELRFFFNNSLIFYYSLIIFNVGELEIYKILTQSEKYLTLK